MYSLGVFCTQSSPWRCVLKRLSVPSLLVNRSGVEFCPAKQMIAEFVTATALSNLWQWNSLEFVIILITSLPWWSFTSTGTKKLSVWHKQWSVTKSGSAHLSQWRAGGGPLSSKRKIRLSGFDSTTTWCPCYTNQSLLLYCRTWEYASVDTLNSIAISTFRRWSLRT